MFRCFCCEFQVSGNFSLQRNRLHLFRGMLAEDQLLQLRARLQRRLAVERLAVEDFFSTRKFPTWRAALAEDFASLGGEVVFFFYKLGSKFNLSINK